MPRRSAPSVTRSSTSTSARPSDRVPARPSGCAVPADAARSPARSPGRRPGSPRPGPRPQQLICTSTRTRRASHNERLEYLGDAVVNLAISRGALRPPPDRRRGPPVRPPGGDRLDDRPRPPRRPDRPRRRCLLLGEGESPARRPPPPVAPRVGLRGRRRGALPRPRVRRGRATGSSALAAPELGRRRADRQPEEPQEPAPGVHPADRPASGPRTALVDVSGPDHEKIVPDRGQRRRTRRSAPVTGRRGAVGRDGRRARSTPWRRIEPIGTRDRPGERRAAAPRPSGCRASSRSPSGRIVEFGAGISAVVGPERIGQEQPRRRPALGARRAGPRAAQRASPRT